MTRKVPSARDIERVLDEAQDAAESAPDQDFLTTLAAAERGRREAIEAEMWQGIKDSL